PTRKNIFAQEAAQGVTRIEQKIAALGSADWGSCFSGPQTEDRIGACGRLIDTKKLVGSDLTQALLQRARAAAVAKGDIDRLLADANEVIRLDPKNAAAFNLRG